MTLLQDNNIIDINWVPTINTDIVKDQNLIPWVNSPMIHWKVSVRGLGWWGWINVYSNFVSAPSWTAPYDVVVTGVWFKPKTIDINATYATSSHSVLSFWKVTEWQKWQCIFQHDNSDTTVSWTSYSSGKVINLQWQESGNYPDIEAELKSMDDDWFTLTVTRNDEWWKEFKFTYSCIG